MGRCRGCPGLRWGIHWTFEESLDHCFETNRHWSTKNSDREDSTRDRVAAKDQRSSSFWKSQSYSFRPFHPLAVIGEIVRISKGSEHALIEGLCHLKQCRPVDITSFDSRFRRGQGRIGTIGCCRETNDLTNEFFTHRDLRWCSSLTLFADGVVRKLLIWLTFSTILSSVPRGIPAINESSWSKFTNGVKTGMAMSKVLNTGVFNRVGLKVFTICLAKLYELKSQRCQWRQFNCSFRFEEIYA